VKIPGASLVLVGAACLAWACRGRDATTPASAANASAAAPVPTIERELETFRSGMAVHPRTLAGAPSRDSLLRLFETALAKRDTVGLDQLQITREEFAYLYYPESRMARPPYELGPELMWMQIRSQRDRGLHRLVAKLGGTRLRIRALECQPPEHENALVVHQCAARTSGAGVPRQLFGSIIERDGRFKFVGFANPL